MLMRSHVITVGAVGVRVSFVVVDDDYEAIDLTELSSARVRVLRPDSTTTDITATIALPRTDGIVYIETTTAHLTIAGDYVLQPYLSWNDGDQYYIEGVLLTVGAVCNLE